MVEVSSVVVRPQHGGRDQVGKRASSPRNVKLPQKRLAKHQTLVLDHTHPPVGKNSGRPAGPRETSTESYSGKSLTVLEYGMPDFDSLEQFGYPICHIMGNVTACQLHIAKNVPTDKRELVKMSTLVVFAAVGLLLTTTAGFVGGWTTLHRFPTENRLNYYQRDFGIRRTTYRRIGKFCALSAPFVQNWR